MSTDFAMFGAVDLDVIKIDRSLPFWQDAVGLELYDRTDGVATLGAGGKTLLRLHEGATGPTPRGHSGLYHLAIHMPDQHAFSTALGRLIAHDVRVGPTDHIMSKAIYADDPDGIGLEVTLETPERMRSMTVGENGPVVIDTEGNERSGREPLDLRAELADVRDDDIGRALPAGTFIGHIHLHVADIERALAFYARLGYEIENDFGGLGAADMHAGGTFRHRIAVNTWQGRGVTPRPAGAAGLKGFEILYRNADQRDAVLAELRRSATPGDGYGVQDPDSNRMTLLAG